jgi:hypothetical protein
MMPADSSSKHCATVPPVLVERQHQRAARGPPSQSDTVSLTLRRSALWLRERTAALSPRTPTRPPSVPARVWVRVTMAVAGTRQRRQVV